MGDENLNPLEELKRLDQQVGLVASLEGLKPIYYRLDEIAKQYANDFEVQLVVGDIKQHLVNRGTKLKEQEATIATPPAMASPTPFPAQASPPPFSAPSTPPPFAPPPPLPPQGAPPLPTAAPPTKTISQSPAPPPPIPAAAPPAPASFPTLPPMPAAFPSTPPPTPPPTPMASGQFSPPPSLPTSAFPSTGPQAVPPTPPVGPPPIKPPSGLTPPPQQPKPVKPVAWKKALIFGAILGLLIAVGGIGFLLYMRQKRNKAAEMAAVTPAGIEVQVATTPPGAAIKVNGEDKCTSPCAVSLPAGDYQVTAFLPGYEPGAGGVTVAAGGAPPQVSLTLEPSPQPMRILAEGVDGGQVTVDDQPAGEVQDGQFVIDNVKPGPHTVKIVAKGGEASFSFETADAKAPSITGATAKNLLAIVVASFGTNARLATSAGPLKLTLNGQPQGDASPGGVDLTGFQPGSAEIAVGEGPTQKTMQETFGPAPALTVFLRPDKVGPAMGDLGTLIVVTGEDDVRVFVNNKEQKKHTARGQLRVPTPPGKVSVRVYKDGFTTPATQTIDVVKGADARVEFQMQKMDAGAAPKPAPVTTPAPVGSANGTVHITRSPGNAVVTYQRGSEAPHQLNGNQVDLPPGSYTFSSKAPGFTDRTMPVQVAAGGQVVVDLTMASAKVAAPAPKIGGMADFEDPSGWTRDGEAWMHKGGNFLPYKLPAKGTFTFTVQLLKGGNIFKGGHIRWYVDYVDTKNYGLFEIDKKTFWAKEVTNGKNKDREKTQHGVDNEKSFTIQIDVAPDHVVHRIKNGDTWLTLDSWTEPGRIFSDGKFGFYIPGNDEIGISDFKFQPK
ncbi:MAG TPA: PEGA domain-containing protein [Bryobacteraceae bacterium]|nr:PEGA domain-containing protein [Bryobacteraceae bacterium]